MDLIALRIVWWIVRVKNTLESICKLHAGRIHQVMYTQKNLIPRQRENIETQKHKNLKFHEKNKKSNNKLINEKCPWLLKMQICPTSFTFFRQQQSTVKPTMVNL
jgi:hypothetical protein